MKKILLSSALGAAVLGIAFGAPAQAADIGACLITKTDSNPFFVKMKEGAQKKADELGRTVEVTERIAEGAFEALVSGDGARHDDILKRTISTLAEQVDVVVLAQVSMARLVPQLTGVRVPVLSSPRSGVAALKCALGTT